jgi:isoleucyl-tRNA synthetase
MYILTDDGYIVAQSRYETLVEEGIVSGHSGRKIAATELENKLAINPLNGRSSHIILGEHVELSGGTGAVHTAPGHGEDDYFAGLKYGLDVIMPVDHQGKYDESVIGLKLLPDPERFVGMHVFKANEEILELLGESLLKVSKFKHSYPFCWRTKKPVIYRATRQWFIAIDEAYTDDGKTLREVATKGIDDTTFYPDWGRNRIGSMIEQRPDWCISRQRSWGVPIAFFRNKMTKEVILDDEVLGHVADIFEHEGCDAWYDRPVADLLPDGSALNPDELEKVEDILDVWFDSGSTWNAVLKSGNYDAGQFPADMYLEGSDQHRGWFQSSLLLGSAVNEFPPYKSVLTHGFTVDEKGEKMSKSKGNVVAPQKVISQYGTEILRLWVALSDYQSDLKISDGILKQTAEQYRKIRNTFRFLLANVDDLDALVSPDEYGELDRWILSKAKDVFAEAKGSFDDYDFLRGFGVMNHFLTNELSGVYMDIVKDRLYCELPNDPSRRAAQSAMAVIAKTMLALIAPTLTYTADEILDYAPAVFKGDIESVFDLEYESVPEVAESFGGDVMTSAREAFYEEVDRLKKEKLIKSTLEVVIAGERARFTISDDKDLEDWFVVSGVMASSDGEKIGSFEVVGSTYEIRLSADHKCPRCWRYTAKSEEQVCERCAKVVG